MSIAVLVPLAEYLAHTPDPDCDYLEGRLMERNVGEISHGDAQGRTYAFVLLNASGFWPGVEIRVQVRADRYRVPDVTIVRGRRPAGRIIVTPPEIAVEVLSPDDRAADIQEKIEDYLQFGVLAVWLIDPERQRAWIHTAEGSRPVTDGVLRNPAGDLEVPLKAVFPDV
jgi:Uma2 family endonuclease